MQSAIHFIMVSLSSSQVVSMTPCRAFDEVGLIMKEKILSAKTPLQDLFLSKSFYYSLPDGHIRHSQHIQTDLNLLTVNA